MARLICAGLGPGDPGLMSVKADRAVRGAGQIAYFRKAGREGQARAIVHGMLSPGAVEHAMEYPVTTELPFDSAPYIAALSGFYDGWAARLLALPGEVVVLCEGDPFFYGSFMHLYTRLQGQTPIEVIPGIPGMVGCWNATGLPMTWGDDVLSVLPGTMAEDALVEAMRRSDALAIMKTGRNLPRVRRALERAGRLAEAVLVERGTMPGQRIVPLAQVGADDCPYFAIVLVPGHGRRPEAVE